LERLTISNVGDIIMLPNKNWSYGMLTKRDSVGIPKTIRRCAKKSLGRPARVCGSVALASHSPRVDFLSIQVKISSYFVRCKMANQNSKPMQNLDRISAITVLVALLAALGLYFVFYMPVIAQGVKSTVLPAKEIAWLEIHIAVYWVAYFLYFTGLVLAIIYFLGKGTPRFSWIETITIVATALAVLGLITGVLYSKPAWNVWWFWDAKHVMVLLNTLALVGISVLVMLTKLFSKVLSHNAALIFLLLGAVALCVESFLIGFMRNIHPQWWLRIFFGLSV
jgi:cytochrome c assembly protein